MSPVPRCQESYARAKGSRRSRLDQDVATLKPAADLKRTDLVQVLTEPHADLKETG